MSLVAEGNPRAGINDRFVKGLFRQSADLREVGTNSPCPCPFTLWQLAHRGRGRAEDTHAVLDVAFAFDQFREGRQRLIVPAGPKQGNPWPLRRGYSPSALC